VSTTEEDRVLAQPTTSDVQWWWVEGRSEGVSRLSASDQFDAWYSATRDDARRAGARQALLDYADLLDGPTYTMNYGSAEDYRIQLLGLLRRDAELLYGDPAAVR